MGDWVGQLRCAGCSCDRASIQDFDYNDDRDFDNHDDIDYNDDIENCDFDDHDPLICACAKQLRHVCGCIHTSRRRWFTIVTIITTIITTIIIIIIIIIIIMRQ